MVAESRVYHSYDNIATMTSMKFTLVVFQLFLLIMINFLQDNHIYWYEVGRVHILYSSATADIRDSPDFLEASSSMNSAVITFIVFLIFEFVNMIVGIGMMQI